MNAVLTRRPRETTKYSNTPTSSDRQNDVGTSAGMPLFLAPPTEQAAAAAAVHSNASHATDTAVAERPHSQSEISEGAAPEEENTPDRANPPLEDRHQNPTARHTPEARPRSTPEPGLHADNEVPLATAPPRTDVHDTAASSALQSAARYDDRMSESAQTLGHVRRPRDHAASPLPGERDATAAASERAKGHGVSPSRGAHDGEHSRRGAAEDRDSETSDDNAAHAPNAVQGLAEGAAAQLAGIGSIVAGIATDVRFATEPRETTTSIARRGVGESAASGFISRNVSRIGVIAAAAQEAAARLLARRDTAKSSILASVAQQTADVAAHFKTLRTQANAQAAAARARVNGQHATAVPAVTGATQGARGRIDAAHTTGLQDLGRRQNAQLGNIEQRYAEADGKYRAVGPRVGREATNSSATRAESWLAQRDGESSILDGPIHDNRLEARADAARKVGAAYDDGLTKEATTQADKGREGKPRDLGAVGEAAMQALSALVSLRTESVSGLATAESRALAALTSARSDAMRSIAAGLAQTLESLARAEQLALRTIADAGDQQLASVERDAAASISSIAKGVGEAVAALGETLSTFRDQAADRPPPEDGALADLLSSAQAAFSAQAEQSQSRLGDAIGLCENGLAHSARLAVRALETLTQMSVSEGNTHGQTHAESMRSLASAAVHALVQLRDGHVKSAATTETAALGGFAVVAKGIGDLFTATDTNLKENFGKSAKGLEDGLRGAVTEKLNPDIEKEADKAAAAVQPRWKKIAKVLLVIAVIIVVAVVVGPAVIGAVGAAAGALGAGTIAAGAIGTIVGGAIVGAAAGAVIQVGNNLIDGERSLGGIFKGVGKSMAIGAIGGAFGGVGAALGKGAAGLSAFGSSLSQTAVKLGVGFVADVAGGAAGNLAVGDPLTLEGVLIGAGIGLGVGLAAGGLGRLGKFGKSVEGIQKGSEKFGEGVGQRAGARVAKSLGIEVKPTPASTTGTTAPREEAPPSSEQQTSAEATQQSAATKTDAEPVKSSEPPPVEEAAPKAMDEAPANEPQPKPAEESPVQEQQVKATDEAIPDEPEPARDKLREDMETRLDEIREQRRQWQDKMDNLERRAKAREERAKQAGSEATGKKKGNAQQGVEADPKRAELEQDAAKQTAKAQRLRTGKEARDIRAQLDALDAEALDIKKVLDPKRYAPTTAMKGDIGEEMGHAFMVEQGYNLVGTSKAPTGGSKSSIHGIDGVWEHPNPGPGRPRFVVTEQKYRTGKSVSYGKSSAGSQKSPEWVEANLEQAVGVVKAKEIIAAGYEYRSLRYHPKSDTVFSRVLAVVRPRSRYFAKPEVE